MINGSLCTEAQSWNVCLAFETQKKKKFCFVVSSILSEP